MFVILVVSMGCEGCEDKKLDTEKPLISIIGDSSINIAQGSTYRDEGATASDNRDGDISSNIIVNNPVNTTVAGNYTVTYDVNDSANNQADTKSRTVIVAATASTTDINLVISGLKDANVSENTDYNSTIPSVSTGSVGVLIYSIEGVDSVLFTVNVKTGVISMEEKDFENPLDDGADNVYDVTLKVIDEDGNQASKSITVTIIDLGGEQGQRTSIVPTRTVVAVIPPLVLEDTEEPFIFTQETVEGTIIFYTSNLRAYNVKIDWGDGSTSENITETTTHTYATAGLKTIKVSGVYPQPLFGGDRVFGGEKRNNLKLISPALFAEVGDGVDDDIIDTIPSNRVNSLKSIVQWGKIKWKSMQGSFRNCQNLVLNVIDKPDLSEVTHLSSMFEGAISFNGDISAWDVSHITHMDKMFSEANSFNQPLNDWNVSNVIDTAYMFRSAISFNQALNTWDTSSFEYMLGMFKDAFRFNEPLGLWDTSSVTNMSELFYGASTFNQPLNVWDVSSVTRMNEMFLGASSFNQNLDAWNIDNVYRADLMLSSTALSIENYANLLNGWVESSPESNVTFSVGETKYNNGSVDARTRLIDDFGWNITDGGNSDDAF